MRSAEITWWWQSEMCLINSPAEDLAGGLHAPTPPGSPKPSSLTSPRGVQWGRIPAHHRLAPPRLFPVVFSHATWHLAFLPWDTYSGAQESCMKPGTVAPTATGA